MSILIRYLRITPMMMYVTALNWKINDQLYWSYMDPSRDRYNHDCTHSWYSILLFYQNFTSDTEDMNVCMVHLWYLQCDMQMFLLLPFLCLIYHYYKKIGIITSLLPTIVCIVIRMYYGLYYNLGYSVWLPEHPIKHDANPATYTYNKPWTRMAPYFTGVTTMFVIKYINDKYPELKISSKILYWTLLILSGSMLLLLVFLPSDDTKNEPLHHWSSFWDSFMYVINRPLWGIAITLLFIALYYKPNNIYSITNKLLSFEMYQPIGKLTFTMYLLHMPMYDWWLESKSVPIYYNCWNVILLFCGIAVLTFIFSLILYFIMEKPIANIVTHIINIISCKNNKTPKESLLPLNAQSKDQRFSVQSNTKNSVSVQ